MGNKYKVSVIVPIYKVASFLEKCVLSLFEQTLNDVEFIFVDDASPDNSMEILQSCIEKYPLLKKSIKILRHECNKGLPSARNTGLSVASGKYIFHCDSDDFVDASMLEMLYLKGIETKADIIWCDWYLSFKENEKYMRQKEYMDAQGFLYGMLSGRIKYNVWNKLVKKDLYDNYNIQFPNGYSMGEDMTMIRLAACAKKVAYVPAAFYHYVRINANSYTHNFSDRNFCDIRYNVDETIRFLQSNNRMGKKLDEGISFFKLDVKFPFLISCNEADYQLWHEWYPEANSYIMKNKEVSWRRKLLQFMAWKNQFWFVKLYYYFFVKIVYGVIYK